MVLLLAYKLVGKVPDTKISKICMEGSMCTLVNLEPTRGRVLAGVSQECNCSISVQIHQKCSIR
jgi:hypothetical protein